MSLRRATIRIQEGGIIFRHHRLFWNARNYFELPSSSYRERETKCQQVDDAVAMVGQNGARTLWMARDGFYWADSNLSEREVELLLWDRKRREQHKIQRLAVIRDRHDAPSTVPATEKRGRQIPADVKVYVWDRDGGKCVLCGSASDLQFDHIIPVALGGGTSIDNIQILCMECNLAKSDSIA